MDIKLFKKIPGLFKKKTFLANWKFSSPSTQYFFKNILSVENFLVVPEKVYSLNPLKKILGKKNWILFSVTGLSQIWIMCSC